VDGLGQFSQIVDLAEEVGIADDQQRRVVVEHIHQVGHGGAALVADEFQLVALVIGPDHGAILRVDARAEDDLGALAAEVRVGDDHRFGQRSRAIVVARVGGFHAGEGAHHALVFEDRLQRALA